MANPIYVVGWSMALQEFANEPETSRFWSGLISLSKKTLMPSRETRGLTGISVVVRATTFMRSNWLAAPCPAEDK